IKRPPPTPLLSVGKLLAFTRPSDDYEDVEALLREFYAKEREELECMWLHEAVLRAKEIPRLMGAPQRENGLESPRK
ncbi:MAG: hypothetical protein O7A98_08340, partial [Acidobacteria bacterium]|nr:hypothetical protein [Acidobacteriota bacterium]